jgi:murein DD-endopeptidase MepM/ murein hydrolase activator NlpD
VSRGLAVLSPWIAGFVLACPAASAASAASAPPEADPPPLTATGATPSFRALPEGHVALVPSKPAPSHIGAGERLSGFVLAPAPREQVKMLRMNQMGVAYLFASSARAKAFSEGKGDEDDAASVTCFADGENASAPSEEEDDANESRAGAPKKPGPDGESREPLPMEWPLQGSSMLSMQFALASPGPRTHAVHAERLVTDGKGQASLEMTDAWVDAQTRGVRLIGHSRLPLRRVFVGPNGVEVYAARDGGAVQVVLRAAKSPPDPELKGINVALPGGQVAGSDCGHVRFALRVARGHAQMAILQSIALLPPLEGDEPVIADGADESPEAKAAFSLQAMRRRPYQLSISASQFAADPDPVLSISVGWIGRERPGTFAGREG